MRIFFVMFIVLMSAYVAGCEKSTAMHVESEASLEQIQTQAANAAPLPPNTAVMYVYGMGCPQCAYNVDLQLLKIKGVEEVKVDMASGKVTARLSPANPPTKEQLSKAIKNSGFTLVEIQMPQA